MDTCDVGIELHQRHASNNWIDAPTCDSLLKRIGRSVDARCWLLHPEGPDLDQTRARFSIVDGAAFDLGHDGAVLVLLDFVDV